MRSDGCNFRAFYGIWDSGLQGSWSILYLLFEYVNCLNIQAHKCAPLALSYDSKALTQAALSQRSSLDWRQIQFSHNETVNRNSHEKGAPYATKISSTKCFSFTLILLSVWALEKQSIKQKTQTSKHTKKPPKLSSCGFLQNTFDGTFT